MLHAAQAGADAAGDIEWLVSVGSTVVRAHRRVSGARIEGRPRVRPDRVLGDEGHGSKAIRTRLRRRGIPHAIPERAGRIADRVRRGSRGGRPPAFDREVHKHRNAVERCKEHRR
ncbi:MULTISPECIES: hypothetical protein [unclassified Streptomyces]|uniref:hypothetical protein n=1 Tax=unclassified Streptomyces TaxID=2593676 RepID=UPI0035DC329E